MELFIDYFGKLLFVAGCPRHCLALKHHLNLNNNKNPGEVGLSTVSQCLVCSRQMMTQQYPIKSRQYIPCFSSFNSNPACAGCTALNHYRLSQHLRQQFVLLFVRETVAPYNPHDVLLKQCNMGCPTTGGVAR